MIFILIGALLVGITAAAFAALPFRLAKKPVPRGVLPIAGGIALLTFVLWNDYSWFARTRDALPERIVVLNSDRYSGLWQPWTYLYPRVNGFTAVDPEAARRNPTLPGVAIAELYHVARYAPTGVSYRFVDCNEGRSALLPDEPAFDDSGMPRDAAWEEHGPDHPLIGAICAD